MPAHLLPSLGFSFVKTADTAAEDIGNKSFQLKITTPNPTVQSSVQVEIIAGGTAGTGDYNYSTQTVIFPAGSDFANREFICTRRYSN